MAIIKDSTISIDLNYAQDVKRTSVIQLNEGSCVLYKNKVFVISDTDDKPTFIELLSEHNWTDILEL